MGTGGVEPHEAAPLEGGEWSLLVKVCCEMPQPCAMYIREADLGQPHTGPLTSIHPKAGASSAPKKARHYG